MADPISIFSVIQGSIGLVLQCGNVVQSLNDMAGKFNRAHLTITSMIQEVETVQMAWTRIREWSEDYAEAGKDTNFFDRLDRSLDCGTLVMTALEQDLADYNINTTRPTIGFRQRSKVAWNEKALLDHQHRIRGQVQAMTLLLQILELPTPRDRTKLLQRSEKILLKSDESAYSIVPSRESSLRARDSRISRTSRIRESRISIESSELVYRRLSFEDDLFTARVYKRNYRNGLIDSLFRSRSQHGIQGNRSSTHKNGLADGGEPPRRSSSRIPLRTSAFLLGDSESELGSIKDDTEERWNILIALDNPQEDIEEQHHFQAENDAIERSGYLGATRGRRQSPQRFPIGNIDINIPTPIQEEFLRPAQDSGIGDESEPIQSPHKPSHGSFSGLLGREGRESVEDPLSSMDELSTGDSIEYHEAFSESQASGRSSVEFLHVVQPVRPEINSNMLNAPAWTATKQDPNSALHSAVRLGQVEEVYRLLVSGARIDNDEAFLGCGPLHSAAATGNAIMTRFLLQEGALVDSKTQSGIQPVHLAAQAGSLEVVGIMIDNGARVDCADDVGRQPLHFVSEHAEAPDVIDFLVKRGAKFDVQDRLHRTPLQLARKSIYSRNADTLLDLGAT